MKNFKIAIIGTRGIPANYGGFETFAEEIALRLANHKIDVTVIGDSGNQYKNPFYKGVEIFNSKYSKPKNPLGFYYESLKIAIENNATFVIMCGVGGSIVIPFLNKKGVSVAINPDGLGFKRDKYVWWKKGIFLSQYALASKIASHLVCDSIGIKSYFSKVFKRHKNVSVIEYGTYLNPFCEIEKNINNSLIEFGFSFKINEYHLVVARLEPENNVETIIKGYLKTKKKHPLIIVGNLNTNHSKDLLKLKNDQIQFIGGVYDRNKLMALRAGCLTYLHGHSVGGTNPSLLEAMGSKNICICHDNNFNKEVVLENGYFFNNTEQLSNVIEKVENELDQSILLKLKNGVFNRAKNYYNWENITDKYITLAKSINN